MNAPLVEVRGVSVRYGATMALDAVDVALHRGEVHAVIGENGAGKSTVLRAIAGVVQPTGGAIVIPAGLQRAWVPQDALMPADLTAAQWIFLGCEMRRHWGWLDTRAMDGAAGVALRAVGCTVSPTARIGSLALPQRKQVQLARALRVAPDILLLDEPTAVLGDAETRALFARVRALKEMGGGVLYVSHRLDEVLAVADRITVLRDGRVVATEVAAAVDASMLVRRMVGRDVSTRPHSRRSTASPVLRITELSVAHVSGVSLTVRRGEVLGLAGLMGAGRSEVLETIAGVRRVRHGRVECGAAPVFVPEDRATKGLVPTLGMRDNLFLPSDGFWLHRRAEQVATRQWIERLRIRASGPDADIASLSGGNQQKLLLARALRHRPHLLLLDEPTSGVDVGAKAEIHDLINQLAADGTAIVLASSDLPELLAVCDSIVALRAGRAVGKLDAAYATESRLAALITGAEVAAPANC